MRPTLRILIHYGKHGEQYWLANTPTREDRALQTLFRQLDEEGCYEGDEKVDRLEAARNENPVAIRDILHERSACEYEEWGFEYIEIPDSDDAPDLNELIGFDIYQQAAHSLSIYPEENGVIYAGLGLTGEVGETVEKIGLLLDRSLLALKLAGKAGAVANQVKKIARDDNGIASERRQATIIKELGDCLWYMAEVATQMNCNLSDVAHQNMTNLFGRKERGTLGGDGDNR